MRVTYTNAGGRFGTSSRPSGTRLSRSNGTPRFTSSNLGSPNPLDLIKGVGDAYNANVGNIDTNLSQAAAGVGSNKDYASIVSGSGGKWAPGDPNPPQAPAGPVSNPALSALGLGPIDYSGDPILLKIQALAQDHINQAQAAAMANRKQLLIGFGDQGTADKLLGDTATSTAAKDNPFSVVQRLLNAKTLSGQQLDQGLNQTNLWFSGEHGKQADLASNRYLQSQYDAQGALQNQLSTVAANLLAVKQAEQDRIASAEEAAYMRALELALALGSGGGGPGPSPGPGSGPAPGTPTNTPGGGGSGGTYNPITGTTIPGSIVSSPLATGPLQGLDYQPGSSLLSYLNGVAKKKPVLR